MKNIKKFIDFINESLRIDNTDKNIFFLKEVVKKCGFEQTYHFFLKEPLKIGTCQYGDFYLNYYDVNEYDGNLAFWIIFNQHEDNLYGKSWDSSVIWVEDGILQYSDKIEESDFKLDDNFIAKIVQTIKSYNYLDKWCEFIKEIGIKGRKYHRMAIHNKEFTWEQQIDWIKNKIEINKLLNRYTEPYEQRTLDKMIDLGETAYKEKAKKDNDIMMKILK